jgi:hypothetical protein
MNCVFGLYPSSGVSKIIKIEEIKNYGQKVTIHTSTKKSHKDQLLTTEQLTWAHTHINLLPSVFDWRQGFMCVCTQVSCSVVSN